MTAVAHNPAFAKKVGISQSVGRDFVEADKGKKVRSGGMPAAINKQDTQHGKMDMPFKSLKRFAGMKSGGKVRRYEDGGDVDLEGVGKIEPEGSFKDAFREARAAGDKTFTWRGKSYTTALRSQDYGDESARMAARAPAPKASASTTPATTTNAGAVTGRTMYDKSRPSDVRKEEATKGFRDVTMTAASMAPGVGPALRGVNALRAANAAKSAAAMKQAAAGTARQVAARNAAREAAYDARRAADMEAGFKKGGMAKYAKGGSVKESKAMVKKEVEFFKKKGAPASMIKHEQAEMKGMRAGGMARSKKDIGADQKMMAPYGKGGMAKYARGGGIESRGKTRGMMVKMAGGGFVRAADGIAQRGKTKAMQVKMKKGGMC